MNWTIQNADLQVYLRIICEGRFTVSDHQELTKDIFRQPFWFPGQNLLFDYLETNFDGVTLEDLRAVAAGHVKDKERFGGGKIAYLMDSLRDYGRARQYEMMTEAHVFTEMRVFRDETEAIDWLSSDE